MSSTHSAPAFPAWLLLTPPGPSPDQHRHLCSRCTNKEPHTPTPAIHTQARTFKNIHSFSFFTHPRAHKQRMLEVNPRPPSEVRGQSPGSCRNSAPLLPANSSSHKQTNRFFPFKVHPSLYRSQTASTENDLFQFPSSGFVCLFLQVCS